MLGKLSAFLILPYDKRRRLVQMNYTMSGKFGKQSFTFALLCEIMDTNEFLINTKSS